MRREELATLFEAVKVIPLRPTDVIVCRVTGRISGSKAEEIKQFLQAELEHARVVVLDAGADIGVIRPEPQPSFWRRIFGG